MCCDTNQLWNDIISGATGGAAASIAVGFFYWVHLKVLEEYHKCRLVSWLKKSISDDKWKSTKTIASYNNLTQDRVRYICSKSKRICESTGEKDDMWGLWGVSRDED